MSTPELSNFFSGQEQTQKYIVDILSQLKVTPQKYPKLLDIFSGKAPVAAFFHGLGWTDITTIDINPSLPLPSFVRQSLTGDLFELSELIEQKSPDIKKSPFFPFFRKFDLLTCYNPIASDNNELRRILTEKEFQALARFFLKPKSFYLTDVGSKKFGFTP